MHFLKAEDNINLHLSTSLGLHFKSTSLINNCNKRFSKQSYEEEKDRRLCFYSENVKKIIRSKLFCSRTDFIGRQFESENV